MPQTSVADVIAYAGLIDLSFPSTVVSAKNNEGTEIPFGIAITRSASQSDSYLDEVEEFDAAADEVLGIVVRSHAVASDDLAGSDAVRIDATCNVLTRGRCWVTAEEAVTKGDPVYARFTSDGGSNTQLGTFRKSIDTSRARRVRGARFVTTATSGALALVEIDCTQEDTPEIVAIAYNEIAQMTADTTRGLFTVPADKFFVLTGATIRNTTGLALSGTDYFNTKVQDATPTVLANLSTEAITLAAGVAQAMTNGTLAVRTLPPLTAVSVFFDETGTATMPADTIVTVYGYFL